MSLYIEGVGTCRVCDHDRVFYDRVYDEQNSCRVVARSVMNGVYLVLTISILQFSISCKYS